MALFIDVETTGLHDLVSWPDVIDLTEDAFKSMGTYGDQVNHPRRRLHSPSLARVSIHAGASVAGGTIGLMAHSEVPLVTKGTEKLAVQHIGGRGGRIYILYSAENSELLAILRGGSSNDILDYRTAATSAIGTKYLARPNSKVLGLFGSGYQARSHLEALNHVLDLQEVRVFSPTREHRHQFAASMQQQFSFKVRAVDNPEQAVKGVDVIVEATNTNVPVFESRWLESGVHITSIAASNKELAKQQGVVRRALDSQVIKQSDRVVVNLREQAVQDENGAIFEAVQQGITTWDQISELGELLTGQVPGRSGEDRITLYLNNGGMGAVDVGLATYLYQLAKARNLGISI